jgi:hypothetical protein
MTLVLAAPSPEAPAAIPGADDPKAYTEHDYRRRRLDFNRRTLGGAYDRVGKHDPAWDETAVKFLDAMAAYFAYAKSPAVYLDAKRLSHDDLLALGEAAAAAGCDDPMVQYCRAAILDDMRRPTAAWPILDRAAAGLGLLNYPAFRQSVAARRLARLMAPLPNSKAAVAKCRQVEWDQAVAALSEKTDDKDLRVVLDTVDDTFEAATPERKLEFCQAVERSKDASPWVVNLLYGRYEVAAAWAARGKGFADTVTEAGWKGFGEHLARAREYLVKAHALHPDFPEAAARMIAVAMGEGGRANESTRDWFDRAVRAQFDYEPAYDAYVFSIFPRWGGSHEKMFDFGLECAATDRYDTNVPYQLARIVQRMSGDENDGDGTGLQVLAAPRVYAAVERLFDKLVERATDPDVKDQYASQHVAIAWRAGRYDAAAALMDKLGDRVQPMPFANLLGWAPGAISQVRLMTSAHAKAAAAAEHDLDARDYAGAVAKYQALAGKLPPDHPGQLFVRYRLKAAQIQKSMSDGDGWVSLAPDADFAPWTVFKGDWKRTKDGWIESTADDTGGTLLLCRADLGPSYEMRVTVESPPGKTTAIPAIFVNWWYPEGYGLGAVTPAFNSAAALGYRFRRSVTLPLNKPTVVGVRVEGKRFALLVNGKAVVTNVRLSPRTPAHDVFAGIGISSMTPGGFARFTDVQVRRIPPAADKK